MKSGDRAVMFCRIRTIEIRMCLYSQIVFRVLTVTVLFYLFASVTELRTDKKH